MGGALGAVGRQLNRLFESGTAAGLSEGQLLDRFVRTRDEAAFEAIVARHGPMVMGVCRRYLRDPSDADDAFQATFLVLVRKADSLRRRDLLGNWLYGVAYKVAARSRATSVRRGRTVSFADGHDPEAVDRSGPLREVREAVHEEVRRLPEAYRTAVLLCYFEGLTHEEAAERLGWPVGTVKGRLARARDLLRSRLARRGATLGAAAAAVDALATDAPARTILPPSLVDATTRAAAFAAEQSQAVGLGLVTARAVALAEGVSHAMSLAKLKALIAVAGVAAALTTGAGVAAQATRGTGKAAERPAPNVASKPDAPSDGAGVPEPDVVRDQGLTQAQVFDRAVRETTDWTVHRVDRLFHWSRAIRDADVYLGQLEVKSQLKLSPFDAAVAHRDRMKALYQQTERLAGTDKGMVAESARTLFNAAERELSAKSGTGDPNVQIKAADGTTLTAERLTLDATAKPGAAALSGDVAVSKTVPKPEVPQSTLRGGEPAGGNVPATPGNRVSTLPAALTAMAANVERFDKSPKTRAILNMLNQPISVNFGNPTPIDDVLKYLKSATQGAGDRGLPIYVDPVALQQHVDNAVAMRKQAENGGGFGGGGGNRGGGGGAIEPSEDEERKRYLSVSADLEGIPLKTSLRLMLKQIGLAYCVKDGLLIISTPRGILEELTEFENENVPADQRTVLPSGGGGMMGGMGMGYGGTGGMGGMGMGMGAMGQQGGMM